MTREKCVLISVLHIVTNVRPPSSYQLTATIQNLTLRILKITRPNELAFTLLEVEVPRRLKRFKATDLTTRFS
jgi:hypothetical protein